MHEEEKTLQLLESAKPKIASPTDTSSTTPANPEAAAEEPLTTAGSQAGDDCRTLIETMFGGNLITGIRCLHCNCISEKEEPFTDLSLAFCPPAASQDGSRVAGPSEEPKLLCQGSVNGGSEAPEPNSASLTPGILHPVAAADEPPLSVPDLVNYFLAPEILDEDNAYFCEKCSSLQRAERTMKVVSAPEYLILTLLRFSYDAKFHVRRKILDNVTIPTLMRLPVHVTPGKARPSASSASSPLQVDSPESSENLAKKLKPSENEDVVEGEEVGEEVGDAESAGAAVQTQSELYVLSSVVMHSGVSSESGHYYSYGHNINGADGTQHPADRVTAFRADLSSSLVVEQLGAATCAAVPQLVEHGDPSISGSQDAKDWLLFNDSRVTFSSFQSVQNITNRFPKDTAYVLMYRKQEPLEQSQDGGAAASRVSLSAEPPLQKELLDAIIKDNKLYLQVCEINTCLVLGVIFFINIFFKTIGKSLKNENTSKFTTN